MFTCIIPLLYSCIYLMNLTRAVPGVNTSLSTGHLQCNVQLKQSAVAIWTQEHWK